MLRTTWACLGTVVLGIILFLYGANYYDNIVGWAGVFLCIAGILAFLILYIFSELKKSNAHTS